MSFRMKQSRSLTIGPFQVLAFIIAVHALACQATAQMTNFDNDWFVDASVAASGDGMSWEEAFQTLQEAFDAANGTAGQTDQIWVRAGTYRPSVLTQEGDNRSASFSLPGNNTYVYGGFAGTETDLSERQIVMNATILDRFILASTPYYVYHVVQPATSGQGSGARLDGFIIRNGHATGTETNEDRGGGFFAAGGRTVVANCTFESNEASDRGGGAHSLYSSPIVSYAKFVNCVFHANTADDGGGLSILGRGIDDAIVNCVFFDNSAANNGGGLYQDDNGLGSTNTVRLSTFAENTADNAGGGIYSTINITVRNSILWNNSVDSTMDHAAQVTPTTSSVTDSCVQGISSGAGNIGDDPEFANQPGGNLRLSRCSPCIDVGNNSNDD